MARKSSSTKKVTAQPPGPPPQVVIARRNDGSVTIDGESVADLVRVHQFKPLRMIYIGSKNDPDPIFGNCGCGIGLIATAKHGSVTKAIEVGGYGLVGLIASFTKNPDDITRIESFEQGWCDFHGGSRYLPAYIDLGRLAREQAEAAYAML